jgi:hypothetical protein
VLKAQTYLPLAIAGNMAMAMKAAYCSQVISRAGRHAGLHLSEPNQGMLT